jgi:hypothetical protein
MTPLPSVHVGWGRQRAIASEEPAPGASRRSAVVITNARSPALHRRRARAATIGHRRSRRRACPAAPARPHQPPKSRLARESGGPGLAATWNCAPRPSTWSLHGRSHGMACTGVAPCTRPHECRLLKRPTRSPSFATRRRAPAARRSPLQPEKFPADYPWVTVAALPPCHAGPLEGGLETPLEPADVPPDAPTTATRSTSGWIRRDGLTCLKIQLRGTDAAWDHERIRAEVGASPWPRAPRALSLDFNCTVLDPGYVNDILDRLAAEASCLSEMIHLPSSSPSPTTSRRTDRRARRLLPQSRSTWTRARTTGAWCASPRPGLDGGGAQDLQDPGGALLRCAGRARMAWASWCRISHNPHAGHDPARTCWPPTPARSGAWRPTPASSIRSLGARGRRAPGLYRRRGGIVDLSTLGGPGSATACARSRAPCPRRRPEAGW